MKKRVFKDSLIKRRLGLIVLTMTVMFALIFITDNVVLSGLVTWVAVVAGYLVLAFIRQRKRLGLLEEDCDPFAFFQATEKQMTITGGNKKIHDYLQIDLAVGEILMGKGQAALDRLKVIDQKILSDRNGSRLAYYVNLMTCLYELGEIDEAEALFEKVLPTLAPVNRRMKLAIKSLQAERLFYLSRYEESYKEFSVLLDEKISRRMRLSILFTQAKMEEAEGKWESAKDKYHEVMKSGNRLAIAKEAGDIIGQGNADIE